MMKKEQFVINGKTYVTVAKKNDVVLFIEKEYNENERLIVYASHFTIVDNSITLTKIYDNEWVIAREILSLLKV